jgi:putative tricarboxylic transport membrane protein
VISIRVAGAAIFGIAALYAWNASAYEASFGDVLGPVVFPVLVAIPTMLLAASLVVFPSGRVDWPAPGRIGRQAVALAVLVAYSLTLKPLGFPLATFGLIGVLAMVLGGTPAKALILGASMSLGLWALFDQVLGLPLAFLGSLLR